MSSTGFFKLMHTLAVPGFVMLLFVYIRYTCSRMHLYPENGERVDYLGVPHANRVEKFWGAGASAPPFYTPDAVRPLEINLCNDTSELQSKTEGT